MARLEKEVTVSAPLEEIFEYIRDPNNWAEFCPGLIEVKDARPLPNGGYSARWTYKMAGMRFEGAGESTEIVSNQYIVVETRGGIGSTITWTFRAREDISMADMQK